jgi:hypothetical protein
MKAILVVKLFDESKMMTKIQKQVPANSVPAAAVRQGGQALFRMTGRKGHVGGIRSYRVKAQKNLEELIKPEYWSLREEGRISSGRVKSEDIRRNTKSEGSPLAQN